MWTLKLAITSMCLGFIFCGALNSPVEADPANCKLWNACGTACTNGNTICVKGGAASKDACGKGYVACASACQENYEKKCKAP